MGHTRLVQLTRLVRATAPAAPGEGACLPLGIQPVRTQRRRSPAGPLRIQGTWPHHSPPRVSRSSPAPSGPGHPGLGALGSGHSSRQPQPAGSALPARPRLLTPAGTLRVWFVVRGLGERVSTGHSRRQPSGSESCVPALAWPLVTMPGVRVRASGEAPGTGSGTQTPSPLAGRKQRWAGGARPGPCYWPETAWDPSPSARSRKVGQAGRSRLLPCHTSPCWLLNSRVMWLLEHWTNPSTRVTTGPTWTSVLWDTGQPRDSLSGLPPGRATSHPSGGQLRMMGILHEHHRA